MLIHYLFDGVSNKQNPKGKGQLKFRLNGELALHTFSLYHLTCGVT